MNVDKAFADRIDRAIEFYIRTLPALPRNIRSQFSRSPCITCVSYHRTERTGEPRCLRGKPVIGPKPDFTERYCPLWELQEVIRHGFIKGQIVCVV